MSKYTEAIRSFKEGLPGGNAVSAAIEACEIVEGIIHCENCEYWNSWPTSDKFGDCSELSRSTKNMNWCCYGKKRGAE